jgi:hypothetical protein
VTKKAQNPLIGSSRHDRIQYPISILSGMGSFFFVGTDFAEDAQVLAMIHMRFLVPRWVQNMYARLTVIFASGI